MAEKWALLGALLDELWTLGRAYGRSAIVTQWVNGEGGHSLRWTELNPYVHQSTLRSLLEANSVRGA